jgi:hypothetical protein
MKSSAQTSAEFKTGESPIATNVRVISPRGSTGLGSDRLGRLSGGKRNRLISMLSWK